MFIISRKIPSLKLSLIIQYATDFSSYQIRPLATWSTSHLLNCEFAVLRVSLTKQNGRPMLVAQEVVVDGDDTDSAWASARVYNIHTIVISVLPCATLNVSKCFSKYPVCAFSWPQTHYSLASLLQCFYLLSFWSRDWHHTATVLSASTPVKGTAILRSESIVRPMDLKVLLLQRAFKVWNLKTARFKHVRVPQKAFMRYFEMFIQRDPNEVSVCL